MCPLCASSAGTLLRPLMMVYVKERSMRNHLSAVSLGAAKTTFVRFELFLLLMALDALGTAGVGD